MSLNLVSLLREAARQAPDHIAIVIGEKTFTYAELFGIVREALVNTVRHADATTAAVRVGVGQEAVHLEVRDDGCGFDPERREPGHYGLESMQARADEIGAALTISSSAEHGTVVQIETPLAAAQNGA